MIGVARRRSYYGKWSKESKGGDTEGANFHSGLLLPAKQLYKKSLCLVCGQKLSNYDTSCNNQAYTISQNKLKQQFVFCFCFFMETFKHEEPENFNDTLLKLTTSRLISKVNKKKSLAFIEKCIVCLNDVVQDMAKVPQFSATESVVMRHQGI